jgi:glycine/D-amino acid oxidase-like deaminating enzyme
MRGDRSAGVRVDGELIEAEAVVVAAGAWAPQILGPAGIHLAVAPQRGQIVHLRLPGTNTASWPVLLPLSSYYLLAFEDSRVVIGATREANSGFDYHLTAGGVAKVNAHRVWWVSTRWLLGTMVMLAAEAKSPWSSNHSGSQRRMMRQLLPSTPRNTR